MEPSAGPGPILDERLRQLASISSSPDHLTRLAFTPEMAEANALVAGWMREAGMTSRIDAAGNLIGRYEGVELGLPALVLGSHLDTVENAGRFDGMLGVVAAIWCVEEFNRSSRRFPFAIEVAAFGDEEGVRFGTSVLGSLAFSGSIAPERMALRDRNGQTVSAAISSFGCDPRLLHTAARTENEILAYVEIHIEQGPILEELDVPLACVSGIFGSSRLKISVSGIAGHAGTTPMTMRRDAMAGAAEMILATEELANVHNIVATVGTLSLSPSAVNVIPGQTSFTVDARALLDEERSAYLVALRNRFAQIADRRGLTLGETLLSEGASAPCADWLQQTICRAIEGCGHRVVTIPSGAGHDGAMLANLVDFGMIFVRCRGGISHHPDEFASQDDMSAAALTLRNFVLYCGASKEGIGAED